VHGSTVSNDRVGARGAGDTVGVRDIGDAVGVRDIRDTVVRERGVADVGRWEPPGFGASGFRGDF